jgi:hypothetical protein
MNNEESKDNDPDSAIPPSLKEAIANLRGKAVPEDGDKDASVNVFAISKEIEQKVIAEKDAAEKERIANPEIGQIMPDGTIYAGISKDTGNKLFAMPEDATASMKWKAAMDYAANLEEHGHSDWRLPTIGDLKLLYNNRSLIGGFRTEDKWYVDSDYWSSSCVGNIADGKDFSRGFAISSGISLRHRVRCVREQPSL